MLGDKSAIVNGLRLHYLDHAGDSGPIVFLHGLSANAHFFDDLIEAGLSPRLRVLSLDLRGRGLSDKPAGGYSIDEHATDVIAWLDALGLQDVILGGHSFGGFLASYVAVRYPSRVRKLILLDIADSAPRNPRVAELLKPSLGRLSRQWSSRVEYIDEMKGAPFLSSCWSDALERYLQTDVEVGGDEQVRSLARIEAVVECVRDGARLDWPEILAQVPQPTLLLYAIDRFGPEGATPLVLPEEARATAATIQNCRCLPVQGNHITMLFGEGASRIAAGIVEFVSED